MKKFIVTLMVAFVACIFVPSAMAYSEEIAGMAKEMNENMAANGMNAVYDGSNIVITADNIFGPDEQTALQAVPQSMLDQMAPMFAKEMIKNMGDKAGETVDMFVNTNTGIIFKLKVGDDYKNVTITPSILKAAL